MLLSITLLIGIPLIIVSLVLAQYCDTHYPTFQSLSNLFKKGTITMLNPSKPTIQEIQNNTRILGDMQAIGHFELYATSLATSKASQGESMLYIKRNPFITSLRTIAKYVWNNFPASEAPTIIIHCGRAIDMNLASFKAVYDKDGNMLSAATLNFWQEKNELEIRTFLANLGYNASGSIPAKTIVQPIAAKLVSKTPSNFDPYPKFLEILGVTYTLGTHGDNGVLKDGSVKYVKGKVNPAIVAGLEFTTNDAVYTVVSPQFNGRTVNVKFVRMENQASVIPATTRKGNKSVKAIAQTNVKPIPTPTPTPTPDPVMAMLQQIALQNQAIVQVLQDNGLME